MANHCWFTMGRVLRRAMSEARHGCDALRVVHHSYDALVVAEVATKLSGITALRENPREHAVGLVEFLPLARSDEIVAVQVRDQVPRFHKRIVHIRAGSERCDCRVDVRDRVDTWAWSVLAHRGQPVDVCFQPRVVLLLGLIARREESEERD